MVLSIGPRRDSVKAHVNGIDSGLPQPFYERGVDCHVYRIAVKLNVVDSFLPAYSHDFWEIWAQRRFSACNLNRVAWNWSFSPQCLDHGSNLVQCWLVNIGTFDTLLCIEEAVPTSQVASVGNDKVGESAVTQMTGT